MQRTLFTQFVALTALGMASTAQANLVINIYQDGDPGRTLWVFSGSAQYSETNPGGKFAGGDLASIVEWKGVTPESDYVTSFYNNYTSALITGSVAISVTPSGGSAILGAIDGLHVDHDTSGDDFGVSLAGSDIPLSNNALVTWSGSAVFPVDYSRLNRGSFPFQTYGDTSYGTLPLTLAVVPEPGTAALLMIGVAGLVGAATRGRRAKRLREGSRS